MIRFKNKTETRKLNCWKLAQLCGMLRNEDTLQQKLAKHVSGTANYILFIIMFRMLLESTDSTTNPLVYRPVKKELNM
jgi:hypothetical protein